MKYLKTYKLLFENNSYYEEDKNVEITSTIVDLVQDFIDEGMYVQCFTVGILTPELHNSDNDIYLCIMARSTDNSENHTLDYSRLLPYLENVKKYVLSEDRDVDICLVESRMSPGMPSLSASLTRTGLDHLWIKRAKRGRVGSGIPINYYNMRIKGSSGGKKDKFIPAGNLDVIPESDNNIYESLFMRIFLKD